MDGEQWDSHRGTDSMQVEHSGTTSTEIRLRWGRDFPHPSTPVLEPTMRPIQWVLGLVSGG